MCQRIFFKRIAENLDYIKKHIAMTVEVHFILHVANGIYITILKLCYSITYTYSNTVFRKLFFTT